MSQIKNGGLDQYGVEPFKQQQFGASGGEGVNLARVLRTDWALLNIREPGLQLT